MMGGGRDISIGTSMLNSVDVSVFHKRFLVLYSMVVLVKCLSFERKIVRCR